MNKDRCVKELTRLLCEFEKLCCKGECEGCEIQKICALPSTAKFLYNAGYRKVDNIGDFTVYGFKHGYVKALIEKDKEIERLKADNEALKMWNEAYTEENEKLKNGLKAR